MSLRRAFYAGLLSQQVTPLVQQFIHDSRQDVIKYSGAWGYYANLGGAPYRNADTVAVPSGSPTAVSIDFSFTSGGQRDEWLTAHAPIDASTECAVYLNAELIFERRGDGSGQRYGNAITGYGTGSRFFTGGDLYANPWFTLQPVYGLNRVRIVVRPGSGGFYFDGFGLNVRGTPQPI
jgi:hypothetical protein